MSLVSCEFLWKVYEVAILVFSAVHHLELPHLIQGSFHICNVCWDS